MSGIFGYLTREKQSDAERLQALETWNQAYGRENGASKCLPRAGMGCCVEHFSHTFSAGQPILPTKRGYAVIDALLYDRDELLNRLHAAPSLSDEELLLGLIEACGFDALKDVNGDFAGAFYDETREEWILFRDHMGIRPLFVYEDKNLFAFSSDIRGLTALPGADRSLNEGQLYLRVMGYSALSLTETDFAHIRCIRPASYCRFHFSGSSLNAEEIPYWTLGQRKIRYPKDEDYIHEMRRLVEDAVKRRLDAFDGPVGGELSGGLDSCVIDILIHRLGREGRYCSWSVDPSVHPMQPNDERLIIEDICRREGISCAFLPDEDENYEKSLERMQPTCINTPSIGKTSAYLHAQGIRVVFSGHGGDEGVSHRCNQLELWHCGEYGAYIREKWQETRHKKLRLMRTLKHVYHGIAKEYVHLQQPWQGTFSSAVMLKRDFLERMQKEIHPQTLCFSLDPKAYINQGGSRNRLDNVALQGAENGVRYVLPYLDYRVIDFAVSIPRRLYRKNGVNRWIFREAFRDIMPDSLYRLNTKDTPSLMTYKPRSAVCFEDSKKMLLKKLDWSFWSRYFDLTGIGASLTVPEHVDERRYYQLAFAMNQLHACVMLQNLLTKSPEEVPEKALGSCRKAETNCHE